MRTVASLLTAITLLLSVVALLAGADGFLFVLTTVAIVGTCIFGIYEVYKRGQKKTVFITFLVTFLLVSVFFLSGGTYSWARLLFAGIYGFFATGIISWFRLVDAAPRPVPVAAAPAPTAASIAAE